MSLVGDVNVDGELCLHCDRGLICGGRMTKGVRRNSGAVNPLHLVSALILVYFTQLYLNPSGCCFHSQTEVQGKARTLGTYWYFSAF